MYTSCIRKIEKPLELIQLDMDSGLEAILSQPDAKIDTDLRYLNKNNQFFAVFKYLCFYRSLQIFAGKLDPSNYMLKFSNLSMIERITKQLELNKYRRDKVAVKPSSFQQTDKDLYEVNVKNVKDEMGQLSEFDLVEFSHPENPELIIKGSIHLLQKDKIIFEKKLSKSKNKNPEQFDNKLEYNMTFHVNGYTFDMETAALQFVCKNGIEKHLFPITANNRLLSNEM